MGKVSSRGNNSKIGEFLAKGKMKREEALELVKLKVKNKNLIKHMVAVESCMVELSKHFGEDERLWALAGLLHDLDYEETKDDFSQHGFVTAKMLEEKGIEEEVLNAIKSHPGHIPRTSKMAKALYCVDPLTGLIVAAALMHPTKKLTGINTQFVLNRFKEKRFAAGANREQIKTCESLELSLEEFITICLTAMQKISKELEL